MDPIERLLSHFQRFPGIGPRQAQRFVQFLLRSSASTRRELADIIRDLGGAVHQCAECMRFFSGKEKVCGICANKKRDSEYLAVVASDADLAAFEESGTYRGYYFVLGGLLSLASSKIVGLRMAELLKTVTTRTTQGLKEIIIAFPANPEGDATSERVREELKSIPDFSLKITTLGRGLSTGSELEYADPETLKEALANRK